MAQSLEVKKFNYVAILLLFSLVVYYAGAFYALVERLIDYKDFLLAVSSITGLLIGYFVRDVKDTLTPVSQPGA